MKKVISMALALILLVSMSIVAFSAYSTFDDGVLTVKEALDAYTQETGETVSTYRYYLLEPNGTTGLKGKDPEGTYYDQFAPSWLHGEWTAAGAGIYWWDAPNCPNPSGWIGYKADGLVEGTTNVWYADVPIDVTTVIWNNGVDGGMDAEAEIYKYKAQSMNIPSEYYDPGENPYFPEGTDNFDGFIWVADPDKSEVNPLTEQVTCGGQWFRYYGGECFGCVEGGEDDLEHCCLNEAHDHSKPAFKRGDANSDDMVDVLDATCIQKYKAQLITEESINLLAADANQDGIVDVLDATRIQKYMAKLCNMDGSTPYDPANPSNP